MTHIFTAEGRPGSAGTVGHVGTFPRRRPVRRIQSLLTGQSLPKGEEINREIRGSTHHTLAHSRTVFQENQLRGLAPE